MPGVTTVMAWLVNPSSFQKDFWEQYARAREMRAVLLADEIIAIADGPPAMLGKMGKSTGRIFKGLVSGLMPASG